LSQNLKNCKTHKKSHIEPLCITDQEYGGHNQETHCFGQFLVKTGDFHYNPRLTPMYFGQKFENFENL
jgi:hypothetical protein